MNGHREKLPYVNALVKEAIRWHTVTPLSIPYRTDKDDIINNFLDSKERHYSPEHLVEALLQGSAKQCKKLINEHRCFTFVFEFLIYIQHHQRKLSSKEVILSCYPAQ